MSKTKRARYTFEFKLEAVRLVKAHRALLRRRRLTCRFNRFDLLTYPSPG